MPINDGLVRQDDRSGENDAERSNNDINSGSLENHVSRDTPEAVQFHDFNAVMVRMSQTTIREPTT